MITMQLRGRIFAAIGAWVFAVGLCLGQTTTSGGPDEKGLWLIWQSHTNSPVDHAAVLDACKEFKAKSPTDPLNTVISGWEGWNLLKLGRTNEAVKVFESMISTSDNALRKAGSDMACAWLSRLDREQVVYALKKYYFKEIEFPLALADLKKVKGLTLPPMVDRWGQSWSYQVEDRLNISRQGYTLQSRRVGVDSNIKKAIEIPYADKIKLTPVRVVSTSSDSTTIEFQQPSQKSAYLQLGVNSEGMVLAYVGSKIVVLSDGSHWRLAGKPR